MLDFGPLAAEHDPDILTYFHKTPQLLSLVSSKVPCPNFIFVSRPGGGKTALKKWLRGPEFRDRRMIIDPATVRIANTDPELNLADYQVLIGAELCTSIIYSACRYEELKKPLLVELSGYIDTHWTKSLARFFKDRLTGVSILGNGLTLKPTERLAYLKQIRNDNNIDIAMSLISKIANSIKLFLVLDNIEHIVGTGVNDTNQENSVRVGSFISVLSNLHACGVRVILFIKEPILQSVEINYKDFMHFADRIESLEWTDNDLRGLLVLRIQKRLRKEWPDVFSMGQEAFSQLVFPNLINGPRDLIFVCNTAGNSIDKLGTREVNKALDSLRKNKWNEIKSQYSSHWPKIEGLAKEIARIISGQFGKKSFTVEEFRGLIDVEFSNNHSQVYKLREQAEWINTAHLTNDPSIEERLFIIGCLGYTLGGRKVYPWEGRSLDNFRSADSLFLSPLFRA